MTLKDRVFTCLLAVFSFLTFYPQYVTSKIIAWMDMTYYFLPFRMLTSDLLKNGILPLWNPYIYCGQPLMANMQSAVLYPPDMLFYVLPPALAIKAVTLLSFFIMAFSMYMFMRLYKASEEGSLLAAFLLSFTYYMTVKAVELADLQVMAWMPAILYFVKKYASRGRLVDLFFIALMLSLSFLGGHAQVFANVYLLFSAYYFFETINAGRKGFFKAFAALNAVFFMIVMMQALPTFEFIMHSKRMAPGGMDLAASTGGFMRLEHLAEMVFPFITVFLPRYSSFLNWMGLVDIGILALFLSVLAAVKIEGKNYRLFLISVFTVSFFISFMGSLPFYPLIWEKIVFLRVIRYPGKINLLFFFTLCVMAGHGFDLLFSLGAEKLKKFTGFVLAAGAAVLLFYVMLEIFKMPMLTFYKKNFAPVIKIEDFIDKVLFYDAFLKSFFWYLLIVLSAVAALYAAALRGLKTAAVKYAVLSLAIICSVLYNRVGKNMYADVEIMTAGSATIDYLKADPELINKRVLAPMIANQLYYDLKTEEVDEIYYYKRDTLAPNVPMFHGLANADGFDSLILADFFLLKSALNSLEKPWDHPAFSVLNVKYISSASEIEGMDIKLSFKGAANLYEYRNPAGPAYFVPASRSFLSALPVEKIGQIEVPAFMGFGSGAAKPAAFKRTGINSFEASVTAAEPGSLVISENYFPGWNAYEKGKKLKVFKANVCFMAVNLDEGKHNIIFRYEPVVFFACAAVSLFVLALLAIAGVVLSQKSKVKIQK